MTAIAKNSTERKGNRRSIRLREYDYSKAGAYYVTVCTRNRECLFGDVLDSQVRLNEAGGIVVSVWNDLRQFYQCVELDEFVVMPNHVHGIIVIGPPVGAIHELPLPSKSTISAHIASRRGMLLSKIIGRFKMVSAKQVNVLRKSSGAALWQRNYYEHVVRDNESLNRIRQYIVDNPAQWELDPENPAGTFER